MPDDPAPAAGPGDPFTQVPATRGDAIRTFHPRRSVLGAGAQRALTELWPHLGFSVHDDRHAPPLHPDGALDLPTLFGRTAPLVLEIGSGMGDAVTAMAAADRDRDYLAVEAHVPGIAHTLGLVESAGLTNVRVAHGDALELLRHRVPPDSLDAVHVFFPDPWPKARHHKRRIVAPDHVALIRSRLRVGGTLHCATDWPPYAEQMVTVLAADPGLRIEHEGARPAHRPETKFERRGLDLGHPVADVIATRRAPGP